MAASSCWRGRNDVWASVIDWRRRLPIIAIQAGSCISLSDILRARILAIACGYEDADDLDHLRRDPAFKLACGKLPASGRDLCSQPTMSRWENAPSLREIIRMMRAMIGLYCASYAVPPEAVTLDIDDTVDVVHGYQQSVVVQCPLQRALLSTDPYL